MAEDVLEMDGGKDIRELATALFNRNQLYSLDFLKRDWAVNLFTGSNEGPPIGKRLFALTQCFK